MCTWPTPTFTSIALTYETPEELTAKVTVGGLVKGLADEAVAMLVGQVILFDRAAGTRGSRRAGTSSSTASTAAATRLVPGLGAHDQVLVDVDNE